MHATAADGAGGGRPGQKSRLLSQQPPRPPRPPSSQTKQASGTASMVAWQQQSVGGRRSLKSLSSHFRNDDKPGNVFPRPSDVRKWLNGVLLILISWGIQSPLIVSKILNINLTLVGRDFELILSHFVAWAVDGRLPAGAALARTGLRATACVAGRGCFYLKAIVEWMGGGGGRRRRIMHGKNHPRFVAVCFGRVGEKFILGTLFLFRGALIISNEKLCFL